MICQYVTQGLGDFMDTCGLPMIVFFSKVAVETGGVDGASPLR